MEDGLELSRRDLDVLNRVFIPCSGCKTFDYWFQIPG